MIRRWNALKGAARVLLLLLAPLPLQAADDPDAGLPVAESASESPGAELAPAAVQAESSQDEVDQAGEAQPAPGGNAALALPPFPPRSQFDDMLERPLFHSSRRPQAGEPSGSSAQELRDSWKLTGIILVGEQLRALFQERNGERRLTLNAGMPLDASWVLDEINLETVVMGSGDEQVTLELLEPRDTTPVAVPEPAIEGENGEAAPLDERTQEASRQLEQDTESVKETLNE
ncbi:hypothetical protein [Marinobacterium rhizophilum]|uniref:General secretion pathway protein N n=1 Tax=Marinobacterium rhizophilum TaxID=420402 RepID=A0ABY5HMQ3_9GAMM|nr:hypothetical protein [Marinobacterium rhizophilum]UTW12186.1 hypothetical protein KDW95_00385 [Marinobacterium rhizophilum]